MFEKRCTLLSDDGVLETTISKDAFELDIAALQSSHPEMTCVSFDFRQGKFSAWVSVGTIFLPVRPA